LALMVIAPPPRRLPGIRIEPTSPRLAVVLPRMDIAVFVGFAGHPLDKPDLAIEEPVAIDGVDEFADRFGPDVRLAWDRRRHRPVYGYLGPAVRAFFRNGGRRCWIVRIPHAGGDGTEPTDVAPFDPSRFLDGALAEYGVATLLAQADYIRYQQPTPRPLRGIHAALAIEEATIVAVPDAIHLGWDREPPLVPTPAPPSAPLPRPEWWLWRLQGGSPPEPLRLVGEPRWDHFLDCATTLLKAPALRVERPPDAAGSFALAWEAIAEAGYILEEATRPSFAGAVVAYAGDATELTLAHAPGTYYYRVRAMIGDDSSDWSAARALVVPSRGANVQRAGGEFDAAGLLTIHAALLRMCAARGDLFAVLSLPTHYRGQQAIEHAEHLRSSFSASGQFGSLDDRTLSFGALFHPWTVERPDDSRGEPRETPPDGAICGLLAQRARRGAWIAPANTPLSGVVALSPPIAPAAYQALFEAQVNLVRQAPQGFLTLAADTLSRDSELQPINVRRLLSLLRRLALRRGNDYVFEPNDDAFRRLIEREFESVLGDLFARGAFAGNTPVDAFRVVVDPSLNPPQSIEQGRLIVELKVAPSRPLEFLTVRLVHAPGRGVAIVEA
jgi:hypothetical protein